MPAARASLSELEVTPSGAVELVRAGAQLVDVREPYEWDAGRIPGARHVEMSRLAAEARSFDASRAIVFVCRVGARSLYAAQSFRAAGYDARSLTGGLEAWQAHGLPLEPDGARVAPH